MVDRDFSRPVASRLRLIGFIAAGLVLCGAPKAGAEEPPCPAALAAARQLLLVTAADMTTIKASLRRFERPQPAAAWRESGLSTPAVVGASGLGWPVDAAGGAGEPRKQEGDRRTPAGLFAMGRPFGTAPAGLPGYMQLVPGRQICVDDPASPHYGQIVSRQEDPKDHGEDMGRVSLYRRGFVIDAPVDAAKRSGSCIFLHVWRAPTKGTVGCVALAEPGVAALQGWLRPGALIAILPQPAAERLLACLKR